MTIDQLRHAIPSAVFSDIQVRRLFPDDPASLVRTQLYRWTAQDKLVRIKRGLYHFVERPIEELSLGTLLYSPSYISLETALNIYGILPDVPQQITSVTPTTTRNFKTKYGVYSYTKIQQKLFFGFSTETSGSTLYQLAHPEKAILDYIYLRKIRSFAEARMDLSENMLKSRRFKSYLQQFPGWVVRICKE
ncbi:MAG: hypothetical protein GW947_04350 [Candidatus Pacebacteria bacterium]|nr:hypothetical protein [Candidatus Paceibacterota bacterium]PIR59650.1 MAG: hypothetical protein COU68_04415 [Candidatus Pacebacteria bacterium CG10_big_fil_rev_8_21_14_0_10_45_6]